MAKRKKHKWKCYSVTDQGTRIDVDTEVGSYLWIGVSSYHPTALHTERLARRICRAVNSVEGRGTKGKKHGKA